MKKSLSFVALSMGLTNQIKNISCLMLLCLLTSNYCISQNEVPQDNPLVNYIIGLDEKVNSENRINGSMPSEPETSLPFGIIKEIGTSRYIIAIDSIKYTPQAAMCSAYMAIDFPGSEYKLAFAGKNIALNPKGLMPTANSRLVLASDHRIKINPKLTLVLKANDDNYVMWDCNGFNSIKLKGYFEFQSSFIKPDPELSNDSTVTATFEVQTNDIHNMVASVGITPFVINNFQDVSFSVTNATVDFSELSNLQGMQFPPGYQLNGPPQAWTGFYLRQLQVKLPKEISDKNQGRTTLFANNFIIDNSGISGTFGATNIVSLNNSTMEGWQFSVDNLSCNIAQNHLNGSSIGGKIKIPAFKNNAIVYTASVMDNPESKSFDYQFTVSPQNNLEADVFSAKVDLYPSSKLIISKTNQKFIPKALLNGRISLEHPNAKTPKLDFQNIIIGSTSPFIEAGTFAFSGNNPDSAKAGNMPITINAFALQISQYNPKLYINAGVNFMDSGDQGFSSSLGISFISKINQETKDWQFDKVVLEDMTLAVHSQAFSLDGIIKFKDNDPIYGKGFYGQLSLTVPKVLTAPIAISSWFGKKDEYKYFYTDASVSLPNPIAISSGIGLYRFMGGLYYHMKQSSINTGSVFGSALSYVPNSNYGLGFKAGTTIGTIPSEMGFNGDLALEVLFNSPTNGGGINMIKLEGNAFSMIKINERANKTIYQVPAGGQMLMSYDFMNDVFHASMNASINTNGISGTASSVLHFDPQVWYVCVGRPLEKANISVAEIAAIKAYFMIGSRLDPMAPPPYEVTSVVGNVGSQRDQNLLSTGKGFVFGAEYRNSAYKEFGWDFFSVYGGVSMIAGLDVMLTKYTQNCPTTGAKPGLNGWYMKGQLYAALQAVVGVKGEKLGINFDFPVFSGTAAALLYAEMIKPSYLEGRIGCNYTILNRFDGHFDFDFNAGTRCGL